MDKYLMLKKSNCKNCYKCIRHCPVKSISFHSDQANIVQDECILCGHCFVACPQNAKEIRNDLSVAKQLIASGAPVYASIAPSFVANYDNANILSMEKALKKLGFAAVEETALGATIVKNRYDDMVDEGKHSIIISSCCHTVNLLIQKYYPEALPNLAHVLSPMQAHCQRIKDTDPSAKTVFIGPCISKKAEADSYPDAVDCALTFEELSQWLNDEEIAFEQVVDAGTEGLARLFPTTGGILKSMRADNPNFDYIAIDGIENCISGLKDIISGQLKNCFIEMSACVGSCVGGPAMDEIHRAPITDYVLVSRYAKPNDFTLDMPEESELFKELPFLGLHRQMPGSSAVEEVMRQMGKAQPEDELNCGSCGYDTCRDKAVAVILGKADLTMCLPHLKEKAESFSDTIIKNTPNGIIVLNEQLDVQQINSAACSIMNIRNAQDVIGSPIVRILDPRVFLNVLQTGKMSFEKKVYLAEYKKYIEQTVVYDRNYHILICIMRDITEMERQRLGKEDLSRKAIEITNEVIEKQMRTVQEIASLLGETTAETKVALINLKESLRNE
ncbi:MAG: [Fe-Fe] hydrogenase large subunit C-terminal domain-containing protein [Christensenellales bacterium]|jgi:iron only hydrogenase large subunit-like protein/uncharacterized Fe-S cluster-containing protein